MAEAIAAGQAVFFIGAGFSRMANAPTWDQLVAPLKRDLMPPTNESMVRQFPELEAMSIIIVSGEEGCDQARMARLDVDCFMTKPVSRDTLVAKARELLDAKSQNSVRTRSDIPPRYLGTPMASESSFPPRNSEAGGTP